MSGIRTDGCTFCPDALWIRDGWSPRRVSIFAACAIHDQRYAIGGTETERLHADLELRDAIIAKTSGQRPLAAAAIFHAVQSFGASHFRYRRPR